MQGQQGPTAAQWSWCLSGSDRHLLEWTVHKMQGKRLAVCCWLHHVACITKAQHTVTLAGLSHIARPRVADLHPRRSPPLLVGELDVSSCRRVCADDFRALVARCLAVLSQVPAAFHALEFFSCYFCAQRACILGMQLGIMQNICSAAWSNYAWLPAIRHSCDPALCLMSEAAMLSCLSCDSPHAKSLHSAGGAKHWWLFSWLSFGSETVDGFHA